MDSLTCVAARLRCLFLIWMVLISCVKAACLIFLMLVSSFTGGGCLSLIDSVDIVVLSRISRPCFSGPFVIVISGSTKSRSGSEIGDRSPDVGCELFCERKVARPCLCRRSLCSTFLLLWVGLHLSTSPPYFYRKVVECRTNSAGASAFFRYLYVDWILFSFINDL